MSAIIIDGKKLAESIKNDVKNAIAERQEKGLPIPGLATVLVGNDPASRTYVSSKIKTTDALGIRSFSYELDENCSQRELEDLVSSLNENTDVQGILVQLPLPDHLDEDNVLHAISPKKDVDGIHPYNAGLLARKYSEPLFYPCTPSGVIHMIKSVCPDISGMNAAVIGRSSIVGMPTAMMLSRCNATPTICHSCTKHLDEICRESDIIVAAAGSPGLVQGDWIKPGAIVIDVGINHIPDSSRPRGYRLVGDVDFDAAVKRAGAISPVPGGVGPMTIAMLMANTLRAIEYK
ncbi:MAG: bifunctional 5,10-methylenetetrahydrofolate dehydrogenase/5,10-methenyltetrahydrofolate cyclohydrolase [Anaerolineaceae bacterium]|nr:bifunctional 5,10-methylenetetrahydrofolate dehydrogenase/5,10-methenyltetrahydrofolate cyclohydrolase [Anaerolineaceae bacterium]